MVSTIYFNGLKMYTELHDTPNGLNKWFAGGKWFLGKYVKIRNRFLSEALLVQHTVCPRAKCFFFNWALRERNIQVRSYLKVVLKS